MKPFQQIKLPKHKTKRRNFRIRSDNRLVTTDTVSEKYVTLRYITLFVTLEAGCSCGP